MACGTWTGGPPHPPGPGDGETVAVYGDYDVDGITSTCLLTDCLSRLGGRVLPYIPDRLEEGYGLNSEAVSALGGPGVTLIVTVDCGHHRRGRRPRSPPLWGWWWW